MQNNAVRTSRIPRDLLMCGFGEPLIRTPKKFNVAVNVPDKGIKTFTLPSGYENHELLNEELDEIVE